MTVVNPINIFSIVWKFIQIITLSLKAHSTEPKYNRTFFNFLFFNDPKESNKNSFNKNITPIKLQEVRTVKTHALGFIMSSPPALWAVQASPTKLLNFFLGLFCSLSLHLVSFLHFEKFSFMTLYFLFHYTKKKWGSQI